MTMNRNAIPALLAATLLALGMGGCAAWKGDSDRSASASTSAQPRSAGQTTADAAITAKVKTAFAADDLVKARNINVDTNRGVVSLNGTVNSAAEKERAMSLARRVDGVVDVRDNLKTSG